MVQNTDNQISTIVTHMSSEVNQVSSKVKLPRWLSNTGAYVPGAGAQV